MPARRTKNSNLWHPVFRFSFPEELSLPCPVKLHPKRSPAVRVLMWICPKSLFLAPQTDLLPCLEISRVCGKPFKPYAQRSQQPMAGVSRIKSTSRVPLGAPPQRVRGTGRPRPRLSARAGSLCGQWRYPWLLTWLDRSLEKEVGASTKCERGQERR